MTLDGTEIIIMLRYKKILDLFDPDNRRDKRMVNKIKNIKVYVFIYVGFR